MVVLMPMNKLVLVNMLTMSLMCVPVSLVSVPSVGTMVRRQNMIEVPLRLGRHAVAMMGVL